MIKSGLLGFVVTMQSSKCEQCVQWASYQIRKIAGCACAGNTGNVFPRRQFQRKPLVSDPGMHHGTCVTHVPWCMSGSLTCGDGGKRSRHSRRMRTRNFAYLARGPCWGNRPSDWDFPLTHVIVHWDNTTRTDHDFDYAALMEPCLSQGRILTTSI